MAASLRAPLDRVLERRRAAALARHYRDVEELSIQEIARRLGRAPATVKAYLYDPTGERAREVKRRYRGVCRGCGAATSARNGKGDAYAYCWRCHPGAAQARWTRERVCAAMRAWRDRYGTEPSSYDWSRTHARRRGAQALERLDDCDWPAPATVTELYGDWAAALTEAIWVERRATATTSSPQCSWPPRPLFDVEFAHPRGSRRRAERVNRRRDN